ncbi:M23 family metallopeptidase [Lysobacter arenosi]|uniref:M23 family metallopeptidase n=1 Tax=Lysobacter arenosi TaxID=2795387 RepID=A0ABX7R6U0_9GAMM|nr:M23 family metallopeptidase [Lysobacter arenosi]
MPRTVLVFLLIVLAGANVGLYRYWHDRPEGVAAGSTLPASAAGPVAASAASRAATPVASTRSDSTTAVTASAPPQVTAAMPVPAGHAGTGLMVPVQGVTAAELHDTFSDARAAGRVHEAIDIMAPRGTAVLAVADGTVAKLFTSVPGGLTIYQFEPSGRYAYYYAHLDRYAEGLREHEAIRRGDVVGYVGSTGNADPSAPHLHFAIFELGPERQWWKGTAINPYPVLMGAQRLGS